MSQEESLSWEVKGRIPYCHFECQGVPGGIDLTREVGGAIVIEYGYVNI